MGNIRGIEELMAMGGGESPEVKRRDGQEGQDDSIMSDVVNSTREAAAERSPRSGMSNASDATGMTYDEDFEDDATDDDAAGGKGHGEKGTTGHGLTVSTTRSSGTGTGGAGTGTGMGNTVTVSGGRASVRVPSAETIRGGASPSSSSSSLMKRVTIEAGGGGQQGKRLSPRAGGSHQARSNTAWGEGERGGAGDGASSGASASDRSLRDQLEHLQRENARLHSKLNTVQAAHAAGGGGRVEVSAEIGVQAGGGVDVGCQTDLMGVRTRVAAGPLGAPGGVGWEDGAGQDGWGYGGRGGGVGAADLYPNLIHQAPPASFSPHHHAPFSRPYAPYAGSMGMGLGMGGSGGGGGHPSYHMPSQHMPAPGHPTHPYVFVCEWMNE
jgi:hypothetical protein